MTTRRIRPHHSLRTQLISGGVILLGATVAAIGYYLIIHQERTLTAEMQKTTILQGRNIALSSEKSLLRADPEFELYPLVTRILGGSPRVSSVVVVDQDGIVQGHNDLVQVSKAYRPDLSSHRSVAAAALRPDELLYETDHEYLFVAPVHSADQRVGTVYLGYSKDDLHAGIADAVHITLRITIGALVLGIVFSFVFFRHISRPMGVMLEGVVSLASGHLNKRITMPTRNEFSLLADAFNEMSDRIVEAQDELVAKERMDRELELARDIQQSLVPTRVQAPDGFQIGHYYQSAQEVGGDYVDVIPGRDGRVVLAMADVSGKGVPGLVIMAMVKMLLQEFAATETSAREMTRRLNAALHGNIRSNMFVTALVSVLDPGAGRLHVANAGHNPLVAYEYHSGRARLIKLDGMPLGPFPGEVFDRALTEHTLALGPGDLVLQYTDGLNESRDPAGGQFTIDRVVDVASSCAANGARALVEHLVKDEARFRGNGTQSDDITLLAVGAFSESREPALPRG